MFENFWGSNPPGCYSPEYAAKINLKFEMVIWKALWKYSTTSDRESDGENYLMGGYDALPTKIVDNIKKQVLLLQ